LQKTFAKKLAKYFPYSNTLHILYDEENSSWIF
jgi:hypothetical protein